MTRCQWGKELSAGFCGSEPMAVGYSRISAPFSTMARAHSGNHCASIGGESIARTASLDC
eukprot:450390-Prorocentrum_minimum.AAC.1